MALPGEAGGCWAPPGVCLGLCFSFEVFLTALGIPGSSVVLIVAWATEAFQPFRLHLRMWNIADSAQHWALPVLSSPFPIILDSQIASVTLFQRLWLKSSLSKENTSGKWQLQPNLFLFISCWFDLQESQTTPHYGISNFQETSAGAET